MAEYPFIADRRNVIFCSVCGLLIETSSPVIVSKELLFDMASMNSSSDSSFNSSRQASMRESCNSSCKSSCQGSCSSLTTSSSNTSTKASSVSLSEASGSSLLSQASSNSSINNPGPSGSGLGNARTAKARKRYMPANRTREISEIHSNNFEKIPKGKLIFIKFTNSFVRYYDDKEMKTFLKSLNIAEKADRRTLTKQIRWKKGKIIKGKPKVNLNLDLPIMDVGKCELVQVYEPTELEFSEKRKFDTWEDYSLEWNKVLNSAPKDFSNFYVYVAEHQRIQGHRPITFLYFLSAYNTNNLTEFLINYCYGTSR